MKFFDALFQVIDVKAGGGKEITMGEMVKQFLTKLEWFDTRWPRIPVPVQKEIDDCMEQIQKYMIGYDDVAEAGGQYDKKSDYNDRHSHSRDRDASGRGMNLYDCSMYSEVCIFFKHFKPLFR